MCKIGWREAWYLEVNSVINHTKLDLSNKNMKHVKTTTNIGDMAKISEFGRSLEII